VCNEAIVPTRRGDPGAVYPPATGRQGHPTITTEHADVAVIGAGIIGLATARAITQRLSGVSVVVLDKENRIASHQTGHNSGVLHSGLYYRPGSLKARLCAEGRQSMAQLCEREGLPFARCGKVVVATDESRIPPLDELQRRGAANGLTGMRRLDAEEMAAIEPHAIGVAALHVPEAGIVDFAAVARHLATTLPAQPLTGHAVESIGRRGSHVDIGTGAGLVRCRVVVNCAGLHSDRVAILAGIEPPVRIVPFRGMYFRLQDEAAALVRRLIYPVPDPDLPFLGVHFTRGLDDTVEVGPNAVLALGREHYRGSRPNVRDLAATLAYPGFLRVARRHWRTGAAEVTRALSKAAYAREARKLVPGVHGRDLLRAKVGIRAQAVTPGGSLVDDFVIVETPGAVHVLNAPSPGATASLAIGEHIAGLAIAHIEGTSAGSG
jgi:L-2-hydroxyglutarate oxidase